MTAAKRKSDSVTVGGRPPGLPLLHYSTVCQCWCTKTYTNHRKCTGGPRLQTWEIHQNCVIPPLKRWGTYAIIGAKRESHKAGRSGKLASPVGGRPPGLPQPSCLRWCTRTYTNHGIKHTKCVAGAQGSCPTSLENPTSKEVGHPASLDLRQADSSRSLFLDSRPYAKAKLPPLFRILIGHIAVNAKFPACHRLQVSSIVTVKDIPVESLPAGSRLERRRVY